MTFARLLGIVMVLSVLVTIFIATARVAGLKEAVRTWLLAIAAAAVIVGGVILAIFG